MKSQRMAVLMGVLLLSMVWSVRAEFRVWTDVQGRTVEAEYVRTEVETVVLLLQDGTEISISMKDLSDKDRRYAQLQVPPRLDIKVSSNVNRKIAGYIGNRENSYRIQYEMLNPTVTITKLSTDPYEAPISMDLVLIGRVKETGRHVIIDKASDQFTFEGDHRVSYTYEAQPQDLEQIRGSLKMGMEYAGYLIAMRDYRHEIFELKASKSDLMEHAEELLKAPRGTVLRKDMRPTKVRQATPERNASIPDRLL